MTATITPAPAAVRPSRVRRLALRVTVSSFVLAASIIGLAGMAWAGPEMGC